MASKVALHFLCLCLNSLLLTVSTTEGDDAAVMKRLASQLSPTPLVWNSSYHPCNWSGISCDSSFRVFKIDIYNLSHSGTLPSDLNSLSRLTFLGLSQNHLTGSLPSLANLQLLEYIDLSSNNFTLIPDDAFVNLTSLETLSLDDNPKLSSWTIPTQLAHSRALSSFTASSANLLGSIPDIFSSFPSLQDLDLSSNHLSGSLPPSLSRSPIEHLFLSSQTVGLSGTLDVLGSMTSLQSVWLDGNKFSGPIPNLSICKALSSLWLQNNLLTGIVPKSLMSLPILDEVDLQNNKLQGPLPVFPRDVNFLFGDGATGNNFCKVKPGPCDQQVMTLLQVAEALGYPVELADAWKGNNACKQWRFVRCDHSGNVIIIDFARQGFQGTISPAFGNLAYLIELHLNDNNLTGRVPQSLTRLARLRTLDLSNNNILPPLPHFASNVNVTVLGNSHLLNINVAPPHNNIPATFGKIKIILLILLGAFVTLFTVTCILILLYKKRKYQIKQLNEAQQLENSFQLLPDNPVRFTYEVLKVVTNNFV